MPFRKVVIGHRITHFEGHVCNTPEFFGRFFAESADLHQVLQAFVGLALFPDTPVEQPECADFFIRAVDLRIFSQGGVKGVQFDGGALA